MANRTATDSAISSVLRNIATRIASGNGTGQLASIVLSSAVIACCMAYAPSIRDCIHCAGLFNVTGAYKSGIFRSRKKRSNFGYTCTYICTALNTF